MRQGDGTDLLGPSDPRSASIGVIYVDSNDDRQSVLTAILTQDKLGFKQVVVVLPIQNKAFQRPVDFDGLKHMRRGLKAEIVFIAPSGPGPAEFARQRRFPVYSSLNSFSQAIKLETNVSGTANGSTKRGLFGFGRKHEVAATVAAASVLSSSIGEQSTSALLVNGTMSAPQEESYSPKSDQDLDVSGEKNGSNGTYAAALGLAAGAGLAALAIDQNASSTLEHIEQDSLSLSATDAGNQLNGITSSNSEFGNGGREPPRPGSNEAQDNTEPGPGIITFSSNVPKPKITRKFPVAPTAAVAGPNVASELPSQQNGSNPAPPNRRSNTGKIAAVVGGATAVGVGAAKANSAASGGGSLPPSGNSPTGPGGGSAGGTSRRNIVYIAIAVGVICVLVFGGAAIAFIPGASNYITHHLPGATTTATVTITPKSQDVSNPYQILGVTGTPDPAKRQVPARIITSTSQTQMKTVTSSGSIPGTRATGTLAFTNTSGSAKTFSSVILTGASGVRVTFSGTITVPLLPPTINVAGFAVNLGSAGNIGALNINGSCCAAGITVRNYAFSGGQDAQLNSVVQQSDINGAADALTASLTPGTKADVQKQIKSNEQVVPSTLQCYRSTFTANHAAGDHAPNVTVMVAITCTEEVFDELAARAMAADLLMKQVSNDPNFTNYALTGNIVTAVTMVTPSPVGPKGTVDIRVMAEGVWVYQFSSTVQQDFKTQIQNKSEQDAINYLKAQPGVSDVKIMISDGSTTLPAAADITIVIIAIPGTTGSPTPGTGSVTPAGPTAVPTQQKAPTPTPTTGLGGS